MGEDKTFSHSYNSPTQGRVDEGSEPLSHSGTQVMDSPQIQYILSKVHVGVDFQSVERKKDGEAPPASYKPQPGGVTHQFC